MDWNWFFSSVAQSLAALVGITAAFVITTVVANQAEFSQKSARAAELLEASRTLADRLKGRYFDWHNKRKLSSLLGSVKHRVEGGAPRNAVSLYEQLDVPRYLPRDVVLKALDEELTRLDRPKPKVEHRFDPALLMPSMSSDLADKVEEEGELIEQLVIETNSHARLVGQFVRTVENNPQDPPILRLAIVALLALFFVGVVFPLFMLPVPTMIPYGEAPAFPAGIAWSRLISPKGLILCFSSFIFTGVCLSFYVVSTRLRYTRETVAELERFSNPAAYSRYLGIRIENDAATVGGAGKDDEA